MFCERCGQRPAAVHFTKIINGQKSETHLCEVCAGEVQPQGFGFFPPQLNLQKFLAGLLDSEFGEAKQGPPEDGGRNCARCGLPEGQFGKQGLFGCGECYQSFEDKVIPLMRRIHGNSRHTGKVPERTGGRARMLKDIDSLKMQLKNAVQKEEFEKAVQLRDHIRQLEKDLEEGGSAGVNAGVN